MSDQTIFSKTIISSSSLYNDPSFAKGTARVGDLFGSIDQYNESETEMQADSEGLSRDWSMVGLDIFDSVLSVDNDLQEDKNARQKIKFATAP